MNTEQKSGLGILWVPLILIAILTGYFILKPKPARIRDGYTTTYEFNKNSTLVLRLTQAEGMADHEAFIDAFLSQHKSTLEVLALSPDPISQQELLTGHAESHVDLWLQTPEGMRRNKHLPRPKFEVTFTKQAK